MLSDTADDYAEAHRHETHTVLRDTADEYAEARRHETHTVLSDAASEYRCGAQAQNPYSAERHSR